MQPGLGAVIGRDSTAASALYQQQTWIQSHYFLTFLFWTHFLSDVTLCSPGHPQASLGLQYGTLAKHRVLFSGFSGIYT